MSFLCNSPQDETTIHWQINMIAPFRCDDSYDIPARSRPGNKTDRKICLDTGERRTGHGSDMLQVGKQNSEEPIASRNHRMEKRWSDFHGTSRDKRTEDQGWRDQPERTIDRRVLISEDLRFVLNYGGPLDHSGFITHGGFEIEPMRLERSESHKDIFEISSKNNRPQRMAFKKETAP